MRGYASSSARPKKSQLGETLSLDHRSKALALYRRILRDCKRIPDAQSKAETKRFVREDFERNRGVKDLVSGFIFGWVALEG
ncbi:hypothetical protein ACMFMF_004407 [Clarireedia jacksonii]